MAAGRRAALAAGMGVLAVLGTALAFREDLAAWYVGYRFMWVPEGWEPRWGRSFATEDRLLVTVNDPDAETPDAVWSVRSGEIRRLEAPPPWSARERAHAINRKGRVAGALGWQRPSRIEPADAMSPNSPFLWDPDGGMEVLSAPWAGHTLFEDLNDQDEAVGAYEVHPRQAFQVLVFRPFVWRPRDGFQTLEPLVPGVESPNEGAAAINGSGWIAGASLASDGKPHPVLWKPPDRRPQDLGLLPGFDSGASVDINDSGYVLVNLLNTGREPWDTRPFLWTEGQGFVRLPLPEGYEDAFGWAIDRRGTVLIGMHRHMRSEGRHFLVRRGKVLEIPRPSGVLECEYVGLTDHGWRIGRAKGKDGADSWRGFIARPVR
jgi:hypothetical protein